jgi:hypothetical protein
MRIAQVAPLTESVPPRLYGGTERIVSYLTEELVRLDCCGSCWRGFGASVELPIRPSSTYIYGVYVSRYGGVREIAKNRFSLPERRPARAHAAGKS